MNEQHQLTLAVTRWALKNTKQTAKKTTLCVGGNTVDIHKQNLVLLMGHPKSDTEFRITINPTYWSLYLSTGP